MKFDMYFEGRIYKNFEKFGGLLLISDEEYLTQFKSFPVIGDHSFEDEQDVTDRYNLKYQIRSLGDDDWGFCTKEQYDRFEEIVNLRRTVAVPKTTTSDS